MRAARLVPLLIVLLPIAAAAEDGLESKKHAEAAGETTSPEPGAVRGTEALEAELARCEEIAKVSTGDALFGALCRGACYAFDLAEPEGGRSGAIAERGCKLADQARKLRSERVEGHYRYALCLGIYLREHSLAALTRVSELVASAKRAVELDERYDRGGGHRLLASLYSEAPGFMGGDRDLARKHLDGMLRVAGDDEENKLVAAKVYLEIGDRPGARAALAKCRPEREPDEATRKERQAELERLRRKLGD
ncbi:hypothetical protein HY251_21140 [bacterium]|nr:hypothetical protein [bacterium]